MGCFYVGFDYKKRKNGYFKIGETKDRTPAARLAKIRQIECFQCLGYLILKKETKAQRLFIESYVRLKIEQDCSELQHIQNDHFKYQIESKDRKYEQAEDLANFILSCAQEACDIIGISYEVGEKTYKRG